MEIKFRKKLAIECTLDSSEAIMFNKGGKHKISLNPDHFDEDNLMVDEIELSFQLNRNDQDRHDFILREAAKHKERQEQERKE